MRLTKTNAKFWRKIAFGCSVVLTLFWGYRVYAYFFPKPLTESAKEAADMFIEGDMAGLYGNSLAKEQNLYRLDGNQLSELSEKFLKPKLKGAKIIGRNGSDMSKAMGASHHFFRLQLRNGRVIDYVAGAVMTDDGNRTEFSDVLLSAWYLDYLAQHKDAPMSSKSRLTAWIEGINQDRQLLERAGIKGLLSSGNKVGLVGWDKMIDYYRKLQGDVVTR